MNQGHKEIIKEVCDLLVVPGPKPSICLNLVFLNTV